MVLGVILRFEALGPLAVKADGGLVSLRPAHRRLLACLLLDAGNWVTTDTLVDRMWGETPPNTARSTLHVHLSAVRRQLPEVLTTGQGAYLLDLDAHTFDIPEFTSLVAKASKQMKKGHLRHASDLASRAKTMWRGLPYQELDDVDTARNERARLTELSTAASATLARALMLQGRVSESITHLRAMVEEQPFNEPMWEQLIYAYYLAGRQVDALNAYQQAKQVLGDELGLEPGLRLRQLEEQVLLHDPQLGASTTVKVPNNLPGIDSSFVGRDHDVSRVLDLLERNHVVTITGAPGIGKTRLAIESGAKALDRFPAGVWLARLAGARTEADTMSTIATAIGIADTVRRLDELYQHLAARPALLLLDNCEHLLPHVRRFLGSRTHGSALRVLATSRARLGLSDEAVWPLRELPLPPTAGEMWASPALQLLADRVRTADPTVSLEDADPVDLIEVCRKTGGIPLSLELTARWMPSHDLKGVAGMTLIPAPSGAAADPPHHASVEEAIGWSMALIDPPDRRALVDASVFSASFTADAFGSVCLPGSSPLDVAGAIGRLVEASLIVPERSPDVGMHYRMLEPLRDYGGSRLGTGKEAGEVFDRHSSWFVEMARKIGAETLKPGEALAMAHLDWSISDFRLAMRHLLDTGRPDGAVDIAAGLVQFWSGRFLGWEGNGWLDECLASELDDGQRLNALSAAGSVAFYIGEYARSAELYGQLGSLAGRAGDRRRQAESIYGIGRVEIHRAPAKGRALLKRAITQLEEVGDEVRAAECRLIIGIQDAYAADIESARPLLTGALEVLERVGYPKFAAVGHRYLSMVAWHEGDEAAAREHVAKAESLARESNDRRVISGVLAQKALVEGRWDDSSRAVEPLIESLTLSSGQHGIYFSLTAFSAIPVLLQHGEWSLAARLLNHFDRVFEDYGWVKLDRRNAAAAGYRAQVEAGLAASGERPSYTPEPSLEIANELLEKLTELQATRTEREQSRTRPRLVVDRTSRAS